MLADWLNNRIESRGCTPQQLANRLEVSTSSIIKWQRGIITPDPDVLRRLASELGDPFSAPCVGRTHPSLDVGGFVEVRDTRWGVAKLRALEGEEASVVLFGGPGAEEVRRVSRDRLRPIILPPQTRCYLYDDERFSWSVGRVKRYDANKGTYLIDLPSMHFVNAEAPSIAVRSAEVERDPTGVLIERGHETTFFYRYRSALTHALTEQRALTRGLTGLVSSRIHLYEHQVEVARRVLSDPLPRYILADEVGLGKTIEAGIVARQHLLDDPDAQVVIVVPPHLAGQWKDEWTSKFALSESDRRVRIVTPQGLMGIMEATMLVVDEAHHLGQAFSQGTDQAYYDAVRRLAHEAETVLLLTATPSALDPEALLALLHIVDPVAYPLDDREGFRKRLRTQEDIGRALAALDPDDSPTFLIEGALDELEELLPDDEDLLYYVGQTRSALDGEDEDLRDAVANVRHHVRETYRLFQRLVRHRRRDVEEGLIDRDAGGVFKEFGMDVRERDVVEALEAWRQAAVTEVGEDDYANLYLLLVELGGADLGLLAEAAAFRLGGHESSRLRLTASERRLLSLPRFEDEARHLDHLQDVATARMSKHDLSRAKLAATAAARVAQKGRRAVVFASRPEVAARIGKQVEREMSKAPAFVGVLDEKGTTAAREQVMAFEEAEAGVLIVGQAGEEGLNLQFADTLIHFDLPFDPNRLEQRTGRLDRLGRAEPFDTRILLGPGDDGVLERSPYWAWYRMIEEAFEIFSTSVAPLQFFFDEQMPELRKLLFEQGPRALMEAIEVYKERVRKELSRIHQQDLLTAVEASDEQAKQLWRDVQASEDRQDDLRHAVHDTLETVWKLKTHSEKGWTTYKAGRLTMLPPDVQLDRFLPLYDQKVTQHRSTSLRSQGEIDLIRPGSPWVERLSSFQEWDDRGQAYAMWRHLEGIHLRHGDPWWAFVFDILVEADIDRAFKESEVSVQPAERAALRRQADAFFSPRLLRVAVGPEGEVVTEPSLQDELTRPFDRETDTNLHKDRVEVIERLVAHGWADRCRSAKEAALSHVQGGAKLQDTMRSATRRLVFMRNRAEYQQKRREARGLRGEVAMLAVADRLREAIAHPRLFVDAVGYVVLSNEPLGSFLTPDAALHHE
jgi:ATP-dependent helicase HepA